MAWRSEGKGCQGRHKGTRTWATRGQVDIRARKIGGHTEDKGRRGTQSALFVMLKNIVVGSKSWELVISCNITWVLTIVRMED